MLTKEKKAEFKNKYGLSRKIPAKVRRQVRQECGFGCVTCGLAIAQYEHIEPSFSEARVHDPRRIALLCGACHDKVSRGLWSKELVTEARKRPVTFKLGYSRDAFDISHPFQLQVGNNYFEDVESIIRRGDDEHWFIIEKPESANAPVRISARFFDANGVPTLEISRNEWTCPANVWDLTTTGPRIEIREKGSDIGLRIRAQPPHRIAVERLKMRAGELAIEINEEGTVTLFQRTTRIEIEGTTASWSDTVFQLP